LASIFKGTYPGPGTTLGPGMVFAWRIAQFASGKLHPQTVLNTDSQTTLPSDSKQNSTQEHVSA